MSCPYCTPRVDPDTGDSLEFCKGYYHGEEKPKGTTYMRMHLVADSDDGEWSMVVLLHDEWLSDFIHGLGEPARNAGVIVTSFPSPPRCPWCGRKLQPVKWLWRLEAKDPEHGLWYDSNGDMVFDIGKLDCSTKGLPMGYDWRYQQDGRNWWSSCSDKFDLTHWYSKEDAQRLIDAGFVFTRYLATEYHEYENETVFRKESCLKREELSLEEVFDE